MPAYLTLQVYNAPNSMRFWMGSAPDPAGGAHSAPPDALAGFRSPTSKGREGRKREKGRGGGTGRRERTANFGEDTLNHTQAIQVEEYQNGSFDLEL